MTEASNRPSAIANISLQTVLEQIGEGVWVLDRHWRCTYINAQQAELLGIDASEILGKAIWDVLPDWMRTQIARHLRRAVVQQRPVQIEHYHPTQQR